MTIFDKDVFLENIGGDEEVMHMLLNLFIQTADGVFTTLEDNQQDADYDMLWQRQLHLLRGSALNIGADELVNCALQAEQDGPSLSAAQKHARLMLVFSAYQDVKIEIESLLPAINK